MHPEGIADADKHGSYSLWLDSGFLTLYFEVVPGIYEGMIFSFVEAVEARGAVGAGPFAADWNGLGDNGLPAPAGLYLFRLMPAGDPGWTPVVTKGILLE